MRHLQGQHAVRRLLMSRENERTVCNPIEHHSGSESLGGILPTLESSSSSLISKALFENSLGLLHIVFVRVCATGRLARCAYQ